MKVKIFTQFLALILFFGFTNMGSMGMQNTQKKSKAKVSKKEAEVVFQLQHLASARMQVISRIDSMRNSVAKAWALLRTADSLKESPQVSKELLLSALQELLYAKNVLDGQLAVTDFQKKEIANLIGETISRFSPFPDERKKIIENEQVKAILSALPDFWLKYADQVSSEKSTVPYEPPIDSTLSLRGNNMNVYWGLLALFKKNPKAANALFSRGVDDAIRSPMDIRAITMAGSYLFISPGGSGPVFIGVGNTMLVDISGPAREGIPEDLIISYLARVIPALAVPSTEPVDKAAKLVMLSLLKPKVEKYFPPLETGQVSLIQQQLETALKTLELENTPVEEKKYFGKDPYQNLGNLTTEEQVDAALKITDLNKRDDVLFSIVTRLQNRANSPAKYLEVLSIAERISGSYQRSSLTSVIRLSLVNGYLAPKKNEKADPEAAKEVIKSIERPLQLALSWLAMAIYHAALPRTPESNREAFLAISELRQAVEKADLAVGVEMLLNAAYVVGVLIETDQNLSLYRQIMLDAVERSNRVDNTSEMLSRAYLPLGKIPFIFSIGADEKSGNSIMTPPPKVIKTGWLAIEPMVALEPYAAASIVSSIQNEPILALAIPACVAVMAERQKILEQELKQIREEALKKKK